MQVFIFIGMGAVRIFKFFRGFMTVKSLFLVHNVVILTNYIKK
ncbi:MAG: hypothetical protein RL368_2057 [Pseudomonadota bacterium]